MDMDMHMYMCTCACGTKGHAQQHGTCSMHMRVRVRVRVVSVCAHPGACSHCASGSCQRRASSVDVEATDVMLGLPPLARVRALLSLILACMCSGYSCGDTVRGDARSERRTRSGEETRSKGRHGEKGG